jgi:cell division septal protein FtsQ
VEHSETNSAAKKGKLLPWATAIMLVVGVAVVAAIYWNKNVTVDEVSFSGNVLTDSDLLAETSEIPFGVHPDSLDLTTIIKKVESIDYIEKATPYVEPNGDLNIQVKERTPIALLIKDSKKMYVDVYGVKLPLIQGITFDVPLVYGFDLSNKQDTLNSKAFKQISSFLVNAKKNKFGWMTISEVAYNKEEGVVALSQENGVKLLFGNNNFATKLENWEAFYTEVIRVKGIQAMQQVDLRFTNQVVTRES